MAVFRIEKNRNYTVMSNYHLRDMSISLKAKGLLSQMLSLPEGWDYSLSGLARINREKIDAIREAVRELERAGYIVRSRERDAKGRLRGSDYVIYEQPQKVADETEESTDAQAPISSVPMLASPASENPTLENPTLDDPMQLNKDIKNKEIIDTDVSSTDSIPFPSVPSQTEERQPPSSERKRSEAVTQSAAEIYRELIRENIEYEHLAQNRPLDRDMLDEIADLILETVCTARKTLRIAGDEYPAELVRAKFLKLTCEHIEFVMDCMRENTTEVRNIKKYLLAVLFNAPSTMDSYFTAKVNHDLYGST